MNYEQKYKDALSRARKFYKDEHVDDETNSLLEILFPELAESEDERIRKALIFYLGGMPEDTELRNGITSRDVFAWLEKQGGKPQGKTALEAINEEKVDNANKVEPKFKVGDFIVHDYCMGRVVELTNDAYLLDTEQGIPFSCEHNVHLWTIQDAKDGDVLVASDGSIFLFAGVVDLGCRYYIALEVEDETIQVNDNFEHCWESVTGVCPATKEQRDLLFAKMKEAGYEWDAEKKELKIKLKEPDVYEYELERIVDKLNEVIGKLGDIHQVLSKPFVFPYKDYTPPQEPWYKKYGIERVTPVTCETLSTMLNVPHVSGTKGKKSPFNSEEEDNEK